MADAGNLCRLAGGGSCSSVPYGETYFHKPNGRWCDGRLIVDFIAEAYGLPLPPLSMAGSTTEYFKNGANFAVGAMRALNNSAYKEVTGLNSARLDYSLDIQLQSFKNLLPTISQGSNVANVMANSLFVVGEIGGVDYNEGLSNKKSLEEMKSWVPYVVAAIGSAVNDLINLGATTIVVPGNYAIGCVPAFLTKFQSNNTEDYDNFGCIKKLNAFTMYHNTKLMAELAKLRLLHPFTKIVYADYYRAMTQLFLKAKLLGFPAPLSACCGDPNQPYHFSSKINCGGPGYEVCPDPTTYISWDGNEAIANGILYGPYAIPPL